MTGGSPATALAERDVATLVRAARTRNGVSQRDLAEKSGIGLRTLREIERGRVRAPRSGSLRRIAEALHEPALLAQVGATAGAEGDIPEDAPLVLRILGRLSATRGAAELLTGTPKQRTLLGLLALQAHQVVERDEIIEVLWDGELPDTFGQLIHTYISRIRLMLEAHTLPGTGRTAVLRRGGGYELRIEGDSRLDILEFGRLTHEAARARAGDDPVHEQALLAEALRLWRGQLLEGAPPRLAGHTAAVEHARLRVASALRLADLALARGQYEEVLAQLGPIARHEVLHEGLHARLLSALAGSGRRAEALELFAAVDRRLRVESGIEPGTELREAQMAVLGDDARTATAMAAPPAGRADALRSVQLPQSVGDFVGRVEHFQVRQYLTGQGPLAAFGAAPVAALHGPVGVGKSALTVQIAAAVARHFPDGVLHARLRTGAPDEVRTALRGFARALGVPTAGLPAGLPELAALYQESVAGRRVLVVVDDAPGERAVRPLLPSGPGGAALLAGRNPLSGLEGAQHFRVERFTADQSVSLLARIAGERRVLAERTAAETVAELCDGIPLAVRIAGMRLAARPHWTLARLADRLADEERRLSELVAGDLSVRERLTSAYEGLDPVLRDAVRALARSADRAFTPADAAAVLRCGGRQAEDLLERLVDHQLLEPPAGACEGYAFPPLVRLHAREQ
ncbi:BTAD domain-containing putative transcriptional regulator [Streptomyces flavochromogenes]|uniref:BTAD domain-containing putative transcriptional regulator n=1 Tax=Streptomyces flavochromogenes TaxID=68199 RepID=UPI00099C4F72|nr:BTAD domain-containing putative transcriptional regulator [Streptomyces flavochromogenes]